MVIRVLILTVYESIEMKVLTNHIQTSKVNILCEVGGQEKWLK